jgi:hypothetical protein
MTCSSGLLKQNMRQNPLKSVCQSHVGPFSYVPQAILAAFPPGEKRDRRYSQQNSTVPDAPWIPVLVPHACLDSASAVASADAHNRRYICGARDAPSDGYYGRVNGNKALVALDGPATPMTMPLPPHWQRGFWYLCSTQAVVSHRHRKGDGKPNRWLAAPHTPGAAKS